MTRNMNGTYGHPGNGIGAPRRPGRLAAAAGALFLTAAGAMPAAAMQILDAADHAELSAVISGTAVNRIALDHDRIARVVRGPGSFTVEHDAARGDLYVRPNASAELEHAGPSPAPAAVTLFLGTERGFTYRLTLAVTVRDSAQILIRNPDAHAPDDEQAGLPGDPHTGVLVALIRAVARREPLPDYAIEPATTGPAGGLEDVTAVEAWRGPRFTAHVVEMPDGAFADASALASRFGPGIAAVWLSAPGRGPGGGRLAVVVRAHGRAGATR